MIDALSGIGSIGRSSPAGGARATAAASSVAAPDFGQILAEVAGNAMGTMKAGESTAIAGVQGRASVQQVVESIMSAEQSLQTAIAVRDKMVSAYQEISRMAI